MEIHVLKAVLFLMTMFMVVIGGLVNLCEEYLPPYVLQTFHFGKHAYQGKKPLIPPIEVPKRWFRHFYIFSSAFSLLSLILAVLVYGFGYPVPSQVLQILDILGTKSRSPSVSAVDTLLALTLITAQCWRRLYETQCISVFSDTRINLAHYIIGYAHYFITVCCVFVEAPKFAAIGFDIIPNSLTWYQILATGFFLLAFYVQYETAVIFASMRKTKLGSINKKHLIPKGGFFKYVSSPHYLAEVIMYLSLAIILWGNTCFMYVAAWVLANQVESALLTHWWYKSKFEDYPQERTAIFPFVL